jgi:hypothetical protein
MVIAVELSGGSGAGSGTYLSGTGGRFARRKVGASVDWDSVAVEDMVYVWWKIDDARLFPKESVLISSCRVRM